MLTTMALSNSFDTVAQPVRNVSLRIEFRRYPDRLRLCCLSAQQNVARIAWNTTASGRRGPTHLSMGIKGINRVSQRISGRVTRINQRGDLVSDIANAQVSSLVGAANVEVRFGEHFTQGIFPLDHGEPESTLIAVLGDSGYLEIGIVGVNVHEMLGVDVGQTIEVTWS